ncbi:MAG: DUF3144 domain-containing protein [Rhodospirillales bacterium]|nr:DUF3144 domain-containing protein [Rhodospirillales bacterium]
MPHDHNDENDETLAVQIANQIINVANARMQEGAQPDEVATGLRHAAANFSAFVFQRGLGGPDDAGHLLEEFGSLLEYYLGRHAEGEQPTGLGALIEQAKNDF